MIALVVWATVISASADKRDNSVRFAYQQVVENIDPFFNSVRGGFIISQHVWDALIHRDPKTNEYQGQLATAWAWFRRPDARA